MAGQQPGLAPRLAALEEENEELRAQVHMEGVGRYLPGVMGGRDRGLVGRGAPRRESSARVAPPAAAHPALPSPLLLLLSL